EAGETPTSIRINQGKQSAICNRQSAIEEMLSHFSRLTSHNVFSPIPWCTTGYYLSQRPSFTFDPLFHAGCYYVQEASSMFLEQAFKQLVDLSKPLKVLDLCAAPGGKSTHIQSLISEDSLLVSNETLKTRSIVLTDNIIKWGCKNVFVTNNDPKVFQKLPEYFDVMVVDAPCSGSGLFRKDEEAINEWSPNNVLLCSQRQQRILADSLATLKEGGILIYSTCSYSMEEDEAIMDWLVEEMAMENTELRMENGEWTMENEVGIVQAKSDRTASVGYRFYPDKIKGEGFFLSCFRKKTAHHTNRFKSSKTELVSAKEKKILEEWVPGNTLSFIYYRDEIITLPQNLLQDFSILQIILNIQYAGVKIGAVLKDKLVPHHALAQSNLLNAASPSTELSYDEAIKYLQRADLQITTNDIGWQVVRYRNHSLGWINALKNRVNNYYPKEIRILKAQNNMPLKK
ncbi:MAG: RNA methyltransferase, partial [Bacteroidota bacterium]|nr:RNA methyltransferase [Bacteroidota bacterium]